MSTKEKSETVVEEPVSSEPREMKQEIKFRKATVHDTMQMKELVKMFHKEFLDDLGFSMEDLLFKKIAATEVLASTWVACLPDRMEEDELIHGKVVGMFSGYYTTYILNNDKMFHEIVWYVHPDYRSCGMALYKHCAEQIKLSGAKKMVMITMATDIGATLEKTYTKMGFTKLETHYVKEL